MNNDDELQTYSEIFRAFDFYNANLFESQLPTCQITLQRKAGTLGFFSSERWINKDTKIKRNEIALNPSYFALRTEKETLSTLVHEMVHMLQFNFGKKGRRGYHNKEWANMMQAVGLQPSDTGQPGGKMTGERMTHYIISGGKFDIATDELLEQISVLSWVDRYPATVHILKPATTAKKPDRVPGGHIDDPHPYEPDDPTAPDDLTIQSPTAPLSPTGLQNLDLVIPTPVSGTRTKFICPSCKQAVWGKPSTQVRCGKCSDAHLMLKQSDIESLEHSDASEQETEDGE